MSHEVVSAPEEVSAGGPAGSPARAEPAGPPAGPAEARASLAERQRELVAALTAYADVPARFDADRVRLTARMLAAKRRHGVEKTWPGLVAALGDRWRDAFSAYAASHPIPPGGGTHDDGLAFARHVRRFGALPANALPVLLLAEVHRGSPVRLGLTSNPRRLVVAFRIGSRARVIAIPIDFSRPFRARPR